MAKLLFANARVKKVKSIDPEIAKTLILLAGTPWEDENYRKAVLSDIHSSENIDRKAESYKQYEVFNDRFDPFVKKEMERQLGESSTKEAPRISCVNLSKTIVNNEASIYKNAPTRHFNLSSQEQIKKMADIYADGKFNITLKKQNRYFKLQQQSWLMVIPKNGKLKTRVLFPHHVDVIESSDPEEPEAFLISTFDKSKVSTGTGRNLKIADAEDYLANVERYTVWDKNVNFIMSGKGEIVSKVIKNPIGIIPIVEASGSKDGEYLVRQGQTLAEFTIQYNVCLSDLQQIVRLQGFSIMVYTGNPEQAPKDLRIGPNLVLILPQDANNPQMNSDAKFISPSPNIEGSIKVLVNLLANFLSSRGVDTSVIASDLGQGSTYSSGLERLLAMIDKFEASQDDVALFEDVEAKIFDIVKGYLKAYSGTSELDDRYALTNIDKATLTTVFTKPEAIKTDSEKVDNAKSRKDLGVWSEVEIIMSLDGISEEEAIKKLEKIYENQKKVAELKLKYKV